MALGALISFFYVIRVFDEHKDYEDDLQNHPDRVLQRGLITLGQLRILALLAVTGQCGVTLWLDPGFGWASKMWLVSTAWLLLMGQEFFIGEWLEARLVLYGLSHMVIMPMIFGWVVFLLIPGNEVPPEAHLIGILSFLSGAGAELARKIRSPEEEREALGSYTKSLGVRGAPISVIVIMALETGLVLCMLAKVATGGFVLVAEAACVLLFIASCLPFISFIRSPVSGVGKKLETAQGGAMLLKWITIPVLLLTERAVVWL